MLPLMKLIVITVLALWIMGCATQTDIWVTMPAQIPAATDMKNIAVHRLSGDHRGALTSRLINFLSTIEVEGERYFNVVEREQLEAIIREQQLGEQGLLADDTVVEAGHLVGVDTLITGSVRPRSSEHTYNYSDVEKVSCQVNTDYPACICVEQDTQGNCTAREREYHVSHKCTRHEFFAEVSVRAIDVKSSRHKFSRTYQERDEYTQCDNLLFAIFARPQDLEAQVYERIFSAMRRDLAPYRVKVTLDFMSSDNSQLKRNKPAAQLLKNGLTYVEDGQVTRACQLFTQAVSMYGESPALYYNLGICAEIENDLSRALAFLKKADQLHGKSHKKINKAVQRVQQRVDQQKALARQDKKQPPQ